MDRHRASRLGHLTRRRRAGPGGGHLLGHRPGGGGGGLPLPGPASPAGRYLVKGNHDYWWTTASKMKRFFAEKGFTTLDILHNNCALLRGLRPLRHPGLVLRGGSEAPQRQGAQPGGGAAGGVAEGGGGAAHPVLSSTTRPCTRATSCPEILRDAGGLPRWSAAATAISTAPPIRRRHGGRAGTVRTIP